MVLWEGFFPKSLSSNLKFFYLFFARIIFFFFWEKSDHFSSSIPKIFRRDPVQILCPAHRTWQWFFETRRHDQKLVKFLAQNDANQPEFRKTFLKVNSKAFFFCSAKIHCIILPEELWSSPPGAGGPPLLLPSTSPSKRRVWTSKISPPFLVLPEGTFHLAKEVPMVSVALPSIWIEKFFSLTIPKFSKHLEKWIEISVDNIDLRACLGKLTDDW